MVRFSTVVKNGTKRRLWIKEREGLMYGNKIVVEVNGHVTMTINTRSTYRDVVVDAIEDAHQLVELMRDTLIRNSVIVISTESDNTTLTTTGTLRKPSLLETVLAFFGFRTFRMPNDSGKESNEESNHAGKDVNVGSSSKDD
ncbi:hypothetical protein KC19_1G205000 [Ceratodon purpureus]|uniref:DUF7748 domain-containing protein n=1 Tax=Ceratodon purpureus TaxID=3225 RepID=A0A8T0J9A1_CERPU|nr:hypothetical protein KC19_1G205000 [Ceratodon purpureus]